MTRTKYIIRDRVIFVKLGNTIDKKNFFLSVFFSKEREKVIFIIGQDYFMIIKEILNFILLHF